VIADHDIAQFAKQKAPFRGKGGTG